MAYATTSNGNGLGLAPKISATGRSGASRNQAAHACGRTIATLSNIGGITPPKGHSRLIAINPNAITKPGTAKGNMINASINPRPRIVPRAIKRAAIKPITMAAAVAHNDKNKLLRILETAKGCDIAADQPSRVKDDGTTVAYHCPGNDRLAKIVLTCGNPATHTTAPRKIQHMIVANHPTFFGARPTLAFACMACAFPPTVIFPIT